MWSDTRLNNGISESDFDDWVGCDKSTQYTLHVTELGKDQILNNQAIVGNVQAYVRMLQEGDPENEKPDEILNLIEEIIENTVHSKCSGGSK